LPEPFHHSLIDGKVSLLKKNGDAKFSCLIVIFERNFSAMTTSQRFRFPKTAVFIFTIINLLVMLLSYFLYYRVDNTFCADNLMIAQAVALAFQLLLNYLNYISNNKIVILATLFISATLLLGVLSSFFYFRFMCNIFG
jgi:hypothetical protein